MRAAAPVGVAVHPHGLIFSTHFTDKGAVQSRALLDFLDQLSQLSDPASIAHICRGPESRGV